MKNVFLLIKHYFNDLINRLLYVKFTSIYDLPVRRFYEIYNNKKLHLLIKRRRFTPYDKYSYIKPKNKDYTFLLETYKKIDEEVFAKFGITKEFLQDLKVQTELSEMIIERWHSGDTHWNTQIKLLEKRIEESKKGDSKELTDIDNEAAIISIGLSLDYFDLDKMPVVTYYNYRDMYLRKKEFIERLNQKRDVR